MTSQFSATQGPAIIRNGLSRPTSKDPIFILTAFASLYGSHFNTKMNNSHDSFQRFARAAKPTEDGLMIFLHVQPGASKAAIVGLLDDRVKVSVTKKAVDGEANEAVRELLADSFNVKKAAVSLLKGDKSRQKTVLLKGDSQLLLNKLHQIIDQQK